MYDFGSKTPRFRAQTPARAFLGALPHRTALGQEELRSWQERGELAVGAFDVLLDRVRNIEDLDAQGALFEWISSPGVPGTPAERYRVVEEDLAQGAIWTDIAHKRISDLELMDALLETKVRQAEQGFPPPGSAGSIVNLRGALTPTGIVLGTVGILGLLVVPLVFGE
jgi:hypothetical protein